MRISCPHCSSQASPPAQIRTPQRAGSFWRKSDGQHIPRFWCPLCRKHFSSATLSPCYRQNKRHKNNLVQKLLAGGTSQREAARILKINRKTVVRKFLFLADKAQHLFHKKNQKHPLALEVEFDDLESFEHSKCKPLSVTLMVEYKTRRILGLEVSQMPAKGHLVQRALKKYGPRPDLRKRGRKRLFTQMQGLVHSHALIRSDSNPHYVSDVKRFFPHCTYQTVRGARGALTGQGELKKIGFDPLFSLNHTCAMLRANINRLFRKTWCTTKKQDRLKAHLFLYALSHNQRLEMKRKKSLEFALGG